MKRLIFSAIFGGLLILSAATAQDKNSQPASKAEKEILVKFKPGAAAAQIQAVESELGLRQIKEIPAIGVRVYKITSPKPVREIVERMSKQAFVEYAEPNQIYKALK